MNDQLDLIVNFVTGSLVLFSSIGIYVLTLNARYTQSTSRVRELYDRMQSDSDPSKLNQELDIMVFRCHLLKWSFGLLLCSALSSGLFLIGSIVARFFGHIGTDLLLILLSGSVLFMFCSMLLLFRDVLASLKATLIHIERI